MNNFKNLLFVTTTALFALVTFSTAHTAQAISIVSTNSGEVGAVDNSTGTFTPFVNSGPVFTDLALSVDNNLFGSTNSSLYTINQSLGSSSLIGNLNVSDLAALGFSASNVLYGAGSSSFYTIDTSSGAASLVANIPNFYSSGDLEFDAVNNRFFATSKTSGGNDTLFSITPNGTYNLIGSIGFRDVLGLDIDNGTLFGYTFDRQQIAINPVTGAGVLVQNITGGTGRPYGAASEPVSGIVSGTPVPFNFSPGLGILLLGAWGATTQLNSLVQKRKSSESKFANR